MLVSASEAELAGDYQPGQVVTVSAPGQPGQEAAVSEADMSRWCALGLATCSLAANGADCRHSSCSEHRRQPGLLDLICPKHLNLGGCSWAKQGCLYGARHGRQL